MNTPSPHVIIIGAGLAGLQCANLLHRQNIKFTLLESSDAPGGRIRTDTVDGFLLDRGFQTLLNSYSEAQAVLDFEELDLQKFIPGAMVRYQNQFFQIADPWRNPWQGLLSLFSPIGSVKDKLLVGILRSGLTRTSLTTIFQAKERTTEERLRHFGFSSKMIDRFFTPFFGGVFLESNLQTSSTLFEFLFKMFAEGDVTLPASGMQAIPQQMASRLPSDQCFYEHHVDHIDGKKVFTSNGKTFEGDIIVLAMDNYNSQLLSTQIRPIEQNGVWCLYFAEKWSEAQPSVLSDKPILYLNGDGKGPINNLCVCNKVAPSYAPPGHNLISVTSLATLNMDQEALQQDIFGQLREWFGSSVDQWKHLRTYRIPHALPRQTPPTFENPPPSVKLSDHLFSCGDFHETASIQGALTSGRIAVEALMKHLQSA